MIDLGTFKAVANAIQNKRRVDAPVSVRTTNLTEFMEAANNIKDNRKASDVMPSAIPVQRFAHYKKAFVCKDKFGLEISVFPTPHAIDQFEARYRHVDRNFNPNSREQVLDKMREVFNRGHLASNAFYEYRNRQYNHQGGKENLAWTSGNVNFIVNSKTQIIITAELIGEFRRFNNAM